MRASHFALATFALLGATFTSATECQLTSTNELLKKIEKNPSIASCSAASGFAFSPPSGTPNKVQLDNICGANACRPAIDFLVALKLPSCTISMLNGINLRAITDTMEVHCGKKVAGKTTVHALGDNSAILPAPTPTVAPRSPTKAVAPAAAPVAKPTPSPTNLKATPKDQSKHVKSCHQ